MKKILIAALLAVCFTPAFAGGYDGYGSGSGTGSNASANAGSMSIINMPANPANTTSYNEQHVSGTQTLKTVPMVYAPPIGVTAPCMVALSGGVSIVGFGISAGGSVEDPGCTLRETSRLLHGIGHPNAAARVMCNNPLAAKALGEGICPVEAQPAAAK